MKKTVKIAVVILFLLMALGIGFLVAIRIIDAIIFAKSIIHQGYENADYTVTVFWKTIADISHKIVAFILLIVNAFFIMFDFYFKDPLFRFQEKMKSNYETKREKIKANREIRRKKSKQKKYEKLKSKIEKMESDE